MEDHDAQMATLADRLRLARQRRGWSQQRLAAVADVGRATIARAELALFEPRQETVRKLAAALGVRLGWLLTGEGLMEQTEG